MGFRARIYNIGAEGQLMMGAVFGGGVAIAFDGVDACLGAAPDGHRRSHRRRVVGRGAGPGCKHAFNAQETLTTLMLDLRGDLPCPIMVSGPWRDPGGMNFPQSIMFGESALFAPWFEGLRLNSAILIAAVACLAVLALRRAASWPTSSRWVAWPRQRHATPGSRPMRPSG
jgi:ABC-type uncharacterized transport system permease subunit